MSITIYFLCIYLSDNTQEDLKNNAQNAYMDWRKFIGEIARGEGVKVYEKYLKS
jgi:hypothetical protein